MFNLKIVRVIIDKKPAAKTIDQVYLIPLKVFET